MKASRYEIIPRSYMSYHFVSYYVLTEFISFLKGYDYIAGEFEEPSYEGRTMKEIETYRRNMTFLARNRPKAYNKGKRPGVNLYKELSSTIKLGSSENQQF